MWWVPQRKTLNIRGPVQRPQARSKPDLPMTTSGDIVSEGCGPNGPLGPRPRHTLGPEMLSFGCPKMALAAWGWEVAATETNFLVGDGWKHVLGLEGLCGGGGGGGLHKLVSGPGVDPCS